MSNNSAIKWPEPFAIENCVAWNLHAAGQAMKDSKNPHVTVPNSMVKRSIDENYRIVLRRMTKEEYQAVRAADAHRHSMNINALRERL